ncbi:MAG: hypothetical protein HFJ50_06835 [Clostridia bacterium]|nr:hypothetical protein [Clostridia bacterium]
MPQKIELELNKQAGIIVKEIPVKVIAKENKTYILMQNGNIYGCGEGIGNIIELIEMPEDLSLANKKIVPNEKITNLLNETNESAIKITEGTNHTAVALTNGNIYTYGEGEQGQLGNGKNENSNEMVIVGQNLIKTNTNNITIGVGNIYDITAKTSYFNLLRDITKQIKYESKDQEIITVDENTGHAIAKKVRKNSYNCKRRKNRKNISNSSKYITRRGNNTSSS